MPRDKPVTTPDELPTEAMVGAELVHIPPATVSVSVIEEPKQTVLGPAIGDNAAVTVTCLVTKQPAPRLYVIVATPGDTPVTKPGPVPIAATVELEDDQVPPAGELLINTVLVAQIKLVPTIGEGDAETVILLVVLQPPAVYVMIAKPALTGVTMPDVSPTVAIPGEPLVQVPPGGVPANVITEPIQAVAGPETIGAAFTVTVTALWQPPARLYDIIEVPALNPLTTPVGPTVATEGFELPHAPPPGVDANVTVEPAHIVSGPLIGPGVGFTVTTATMKQPPGKV